MIPVTAQDMYDVILQGINKEHTGTLTPSEFLVLVNDSQLEVVTNRYNEQELTQKRIDDSRNLHTVDVIPNTGTAAPGAEVFALPYNPNSPVTTTGNPNGDNNGYLFMLNCSFTVQYVNNICELEGISDFIGAKVMKTDKRFEIKNDPFNKPKDSRLYYEIIGDEVRLITGTSSYGIQCRMEYLRYPRNIELTGPVNCELPLHVRSEICDTAVRKYLENIADPRYQTKMVENSQNIV